MLRFSFATNVIFLSLNIIAGSAILIILRSRLVKLCKQNGETCVFRQRQTGRVSEPNLSMETSLVIYCAWM